MARSIQSQPRQSQSQSSSENAIVIVEQEHLPLDRHPAAVYLASLSSPRSRRVMEQALRAVVSILQDIDMEKASILSVDWGTLRYPHTAAIRAQLAEEYAPATANRTLSALRGVLKEAWRLGYMSAEDYQRAIDIKNVRGTTVPAGRELAKREIADLVDVCKDGTLAGVRDRAIIGLLYTCGLRRAEIVGLDVSDYDAENGKLIVRAGKGRKQRTVYVTGGAASALGMWLAPYKPETITLETPQEDSKPKRGSARRRGGGRGQQEAISVPLFVPVLKSDKIAVRRLNAQTIYDMLKRRAEQAGVRDFSPHDFRRTFVGDLLDRGVDIATVANMAGHASVDTTRRYDRRPEDTKRAAAEKLDFPE